MCFMKDKCFNQWLCEASFLSIFGAFTVSKVICENKSLVASCFINEFHSQIADNFVSFRGISYARGIHLMLQISACIIENLMKQAPDHQ